MCLFCGTSGPWSTVWRSVTVGVLVAYRIAVNSDGSTVESTSVKHQSCTGGLLFLKCNGGGMGIGIMADGADLAAEPEGYMSVLCR